MPAVPLPDEVLAYHRDKIAVRAKAENRAPAFQMVVDDIYAISKSRLIRGLECLAIADSGMKPIRSKITITGTVCRAAGRHADYGNARESFSRSHP